MGIVDLVGPVCSAIRQMQAELTEEVVITDSLVPVGFGVYAGGAERRGSKSV